LQLSALQSLELLGIYLIRRNLPSGFEHSAAPEPGQSGFPKGAHINHINRINNEINEIKGYTLNQTSC
jgi:hypothetical protein